jgi:predicted Zn-dependent peptidase
MIEPALLTAFRFAKITLSNGLDVIVHHRPQFPIVAINLWYHVGSKNEERHQRGFTHLVEHLMFEGSLHYPGDFFKHLQPLGANINGSTSSDRTNYFVDLSTAHAERAIAMESDRMAHLIGALDRVKLGLQKDVVKNEYRQNYPNKPYGRVWPLVAEALYPPQHPYSWLTIGAMEDVDRASIDDISSFFRRFYVPSNASLAIAGDLEADQAFGLACKYFESIPGGAKAVRPRVPDLGLTATTSIVLGDRVALDRLYLVWPTVCHFDQDDAALILLGDVLARGRSSRLYRKLVIEQEVAQDVTAYQSARELAGSFAIIVTLRPSRAIEHARSLVDEELGRITASGVQDDELARAQNQRASAFCFALEYLGGFGGVADRLNAYNVFRGDPGFFTGDLARLERVATSELPAAARRYLDGRPRIELSVLGRSRATTAHVLDRSLVPTSGPPTGFQPPSPDIVKLASGIPLWILRRDDVPTVTGSIVVKGGASQQPPHQAGLLQLALAMLDEGTISRSAEQIAYATESVGATITAGCGWDGSFVSFKCLRRDLAVTLDVTADMLLNPTFPGHEWKRVHSQTLARLRAERDSAEARASRALLLGLYPVEHPYRFPLDGTESTVAQLDRSDLARIHAQCLLPGQATIIVAGDVEADELAAELERRLDPWRGSRPGYPTVPATVDGSALRLLALDRPGAEQAVVRVGHVGIARSSPAFEHVLLLNQILGGQFTSRLNNRLREERGLTYGIRSRFDSRTLPGPFAISAAVQPERLAEALEEIRTELSEFVNERPPGQAELELARRSLIEGHSRYFETQSALVNRFAGLFMHGLPVDHDGGFRERLLAIERDALCEAARCEIRPESLLTVVVADLSRVLEDLKRLNWADVEVIED